MIDLLNLIIILSLGVGLPYGIFWLKTKPTRDCNRRFKEIKNNYDKSSIEEKVWLYCHHYDMIVESRNNEVYIRNANSGAYYNRSFTDTWISIHHVTQHCNFSNLENLLLLLEKYRSLSAMSITSIKPDKPPARQIVKQEDLSHLLEGLEDPQEIRVIESIIKRSKQ